MFWSFSERSTLATLVVVNSTSFEAGKHFGFRFATKLWSCACFSRALVTDLCVNKMEQDQREQLNHYSILKLAFIQLDAKKGGGGDSHSRSVLVN